MQASVHPPTHPSTRAYIHSYTPATICLPLFTRPDPDCAAQVGRLQDSSLHLLPEGMALANACFTGPLIQSTNVCQQVTRRSEYLGGQKICPEGKRSSQRFNISLNFGSVPGWKVEEHGFYPSCQYRGNFKKHCPKAMVYCTPKPRCMLWRVTRSNFQERELSKWGHSGPLRSIIDHSLWSGPHTSHTYS